MRRTIMMPDDMDLAKAAREEDMIHEMLERAEEKPSCFNCCHSINGVTSSGRMRRYCMLDWRDVAKRKPCDKYERHCSAANA